MQPMGWTSCCACRNIALENKLPFVQLVEAPAPT
jgi:hypothetical protein